MKITPEVMARSNSESAHGKALMIWAHENINKYPDLRWLTLIGHGGLKDQITAANMKAEGLKKGVPDYLLLVRRGNYAALWIELKRPAKNGKRAGILSDEQREWLLQAIECGHKAVICLGYKDAISVIVAYLDQRNRIMPLKKGSSDKARSENTAKEIKAGKSKEQAEVE